jgi:hypothetical protein
MKNFAELLSVEPLKRTYEFPLKTKNNETLYYNIIEITEIKKTEIHLDAIKYAEKELSKKGFVIDLNKKDTSSPEILIVFDQLVKTYYEFALLAETTIDPDTNKPIFSTKTLIESNVNFGFFQKLWENYQEFVAETNLYLNQITDNDIKMVAETVLGGEATATFLDDCTRNWTRRNYKQVLQFLTYQIKRSEKK